MKLRVEQPDGSMKEHEFVSLSERRRLLLMTKPEHRWVDPKTGDITVTRDLVPFVKCTQCEAPASWAVRLAYSFVGGVQTLYYYCALLREDPRFNLNPNVWGCDTCRIAGFIPPTEAANDRV